MELCKGSLMDDIKRDPLSEALLLRYLKGLAAGFHYLHSVRAQLLPMFLCLPALFDTPLLLLLTFGWSFPYLCFPAPVLALFATGKEYCAPGREGRQHPCWPGDGPSSPALHPLVPPYLYHLRLIMPPLVLFLMIPPITSSSLPSFPLPCLRNCPRNPWCAGWKHSSGRPGPGHPSRCPALVMLLPCDAARCCLSAYLPPLPPPSSPGAGETEADSKAMMSTNAMATLREERGHMVYRSPETYLRRGEGQVIAGGSIDRGGCCRFVL